MTTSYSAWMRAGLDFWMLSAEAGTVMNMRLAKLAGGGAGASVEAELMVSEKVRAMIELQMKMMTGAFGTTPLSNMHGTLKHYRRKVAANDKRLRRAR